MLRDEVISNVLYDYLDSSGIDEIMAQSSIYVSFTRVRFYLS